MQRLNRGLHIGDGGRHQGRQTYKLCTRLSHSLDHALGGDIAAKVKHIVPVVFQNNADDVFADVVYIALDGGNDDLALAALRLPGGGDLRLDGLKGSLGGGGCLQQLRQENSSLFKAIPHGVQRGNQRSVYDIERLPHRQGGVCGRAGLGL